MAEKDQPTGRRNLAVPAAAQAQSGGLVSVGTGSVRSGPHARPADFSVRRLQHLLLVPRDGARKFRISRHRGGDERAVCLHQSGPRGTSRRGPAVHDGRSGADAPGGLADERFFDAGPAAVLRGERTFRRPTIRSRPGFVSLLRGISDAYKNRRDQVDHSANQVRDILRQASVPDQPRQTITLDKPFIERLVARSESDYDPASGGFGSAPKFPRQSLLELLLVYNRINPDDKRMARLRHTLDSMANGGIRDQLGRRVPPLQHRRRLAGAAL